MRCIFLAEHLVKFTLCSSLECYWSVYWSFCAEHVRVCLSTATPSLLPPTPASLKPFSDICYCCWSDFIDMLVWNHLDWYLFVLFIDMVENMEMTDARRALTVWDVKKVSNELYSSRYRFSKCKCLESWSGFGFVCVSIAISTCRRCLALSLYFRMYHWQFLLSLVTRDQFSPFYSLFFWKMADSL